MAAVMDGWRRPLTGKRSYVSLCSTESEQVGLQMAEHLGRSLSAKYGQGSSTDGLAFRRAASWQQQLYHRTVGV